MSAAEPEAPVVVDEVQGRAAFAELQAKLEAIDPEKLVSTRGTDASLALTRLIQLGEWVKKPEIHAAFERLDPEVFDLAYLDLIERAAQAALYLIVKIKLASASATEAKLPESLVAEATEVRARMLRLLDYYFDDDPVVGPRLVEVRQNRGYLDLAEDLVKLATIEDEQIEVIQGDTRHFRATDRADAHRLADRIRKEIDAQTQAELKELNGQFARAWTLAVEATREVCAAGQLLFRHDPATLDRFVSLHTLGRRPISAARSPKPKGDQKPKPDDTDDLDD